MDTKPFTSPASNSAQTTDKKEYTRSPKRPGRKARKSQKPTVQKTEHELATPGRTRKQERRRTKKCKRLEKLALRKPHDAVQPRPKLCIASNDESHDAVPQQSDLFTASNKESPHAAIHKDAVAQHSNLSTASDDEPYDAIPQHPNPSTAPEAESLQEATNSQPTTPQEYPPPTNPHFTAAILRYIRPPHPPLKSRLIAHLLKASPTRPKPRKQSATPSTPNLLPITPMRAPSPQLDHLATPTSPPHILSALSLLHLLHTRTTRLQAHFDVLDAEIKQCALDVQRLASNPHHEAGKPQPIAAATKLQTLQEMATLASRHWYDVFVLECALRDVVDEGARGVLEGYVEEVRGEFGERVREYDEGIWGVMVGGWPGVMRKTVGEMVGGG